MATRAVRLQRTYEVLQLSDEVQEYLRQERVTNVARLASIEPTLLEEWAQGTTPLTESDASEITKFRTWYHEWTRPGGGNLADFMTDFTEDMWDTYFPEDEASVHEEEGLQHGRSEEVE